ncbi:Bug family tripartite tricarboxylate transporter substrate binding protein [Advenella kashmirensis]
MKKKPNDKLLKFILALGTLLLSTFSAAVHAEYPEKNIEYIVQSGVGGGSDILARMLAKVLQEEQLLPVKMLVENRPGGAGAIAYNYIASHKSDPYILGGVGVSFFTTPLMNKSQVDYKSFTPLAAIAESPYILAVRSDSDIKSVEDLKTAKNLTAGTAAAVSDPTLLAKMTSEKLGIEIRVVPFDGEGEVLSAVLGGHVGLVYGNPSEIIEQINAGALRPLAVTAAERISSLPKTPTFKELGYDITHFQLRGIVMPGEVEPDVIAFWEKTLKKVADSTAWKEQYINRFNETPAFVGSQEFAKQMVQTSQKYESMMKDMKLVK